MEAGDGRSRENMSCESPRPARGAQLFRRFRYLPALCANLVIMVAPAVHAAERRSVLLRQGLPSRPSAFIGASAQVLSHPMRQHGARHVRCPPYVAETFRSVPAGKSRRLLTCTMSTDDGSVLSDEGFRTYLQEAPKRLKRGSEGASLQPVWLL